MPEPVAEVESSPVFPSVEEIEPDEEGGPIASDGFNYQDEIAVSFMIDMLQDASILKIHFETHDDLVVIRQVHNSSEQIAEYVQVKGTKDDKMWSVADLCRREGNIKPSIFETSFCHDKHCETSQFRIVTLRSVVTELKPLTYQFGSDGRKPDCKEMQVLTVEIEKRSSGFLSNKKNNTAFWLTNCFWDERDSEKAVRNSNSIRLQKLSFNEGRGLLPEHVEILLQEFRVLAKSAGAAKWKSHKEKKILIRDMLRGLWEKRTQEIVDGASAPIGGKLREKMEKAGLPDDVIQMAIELRRDYAAAVRTSRYMKSDDIAQLQNRAKGDVQTLRARFIADQLALEPVGFHTACLDCMDTVNLARPENAGDVSAFLKGFMYDIADRCLLRFERPTQ